MLQSSRQRWSTWLHWPKTKHRKVSTSSWDKSWAKQPRAPSSLINGIFFLFSLLRSCLKPRFFACTHTYLSSDWATVCFLSSTGEGLNRETIEHLLKVSAGAVPLLLEAIFSAAAAAAADQGYLTATTKHRTDQMFTLLACLWLFQVVSPTCKKGT